MRLWALLKCLQAEGCEVDVLCFGAPPKREDDNTDLRGFCRKIDFVAHADISISKGLNVGGRLAAVLSPYPYAVARSRSAEMTARIASCLGEVDVVLCEETNLLINLPTPLPVPLLVDHHNAEHLLLQRYARQEPNPLKSAYASLESHKTYRWEAAACAWASVVLVCSDHDRSVFSRMKPGTPIVTAPNVIDIAAYTPCDKDDGRTILYTGGMDWYPNRDAVEFLAKYIFPDVRRAVPDARFVVAGRSPSEQFRARFAGEPGIVFTGTVPDMREELRNAAVCAVPLRIGSGTRLKILEAAAMAKALVSTPLGAEGLSFEHGSDILIAAKAADFTQATVALLKESSLRRRLGEAARARVEEHYSYAALKRSLRPVLEALIVTGDRSRVAKRN
jgi:glycosyltransferase involved in cell wall biosynthesis